MKPFVCLTVGLAALAFGAADLRGQNTGMVVITEIMYHPAGGGQDVEYIEIHNATPAPVDLSGWFFCRGVDFVFPDGILLAGSAYLTVCANQEAVRKRYGIENTVGNWASCGKEGGIGCALSNGGETIDLCEANGITHAVMTYNDRGRWPSGADGTGHSLELTYVHAEQDDPDSWAISGVFGGSPGGANDTAVDALPIVINEALLLTGGERWVELYNASGVEVDISGFFITDDRDELLKAMIPANTVVSARGWATFTDAALGLDFTPDQRQGETPRKFIALTRSEPTRVIDAVRFDPVAEEKSGGRIPDGDEDLSDRAEPSRGAANFVTVETDVVINEFLYHGWDNDPKREFVELFNVSEERTIDVSGWRMTKGLNFDFPAGTTIPPQGYVVLARDPAFIRETYELPETIVFGPDTNDAEAVAAFGQLRDDGERIVLRDQFGNIADRVRYHDGGEWPVWADGGGSSAELIDPSQENNVAGAWDSSDDSEKSPVVEYAYEGSITTGQGEMHLLLMGRGITIVDDLNIFRREAIFETSETFIGSDVEWRYFKGTEEPSEPRSAWRELDFDDSTWLEGKLPMGFGEDEVDDGTNLGDMRNNYTSFYLRREFTVADPENLTGLTLETVYDDGFVAAINGTVVHVENMRELKGGGVDDAYDSIAASNREKNRVFVDLSNLSGVIVQGRNVLALQVHNARASGSDALIIASLLRGEFVDGDGPNQIENGDFEKELAVGRATPGFWLVEGTHYKSGRTTKEALVGNGSLKVIATGKGDNKVNRLEATLETRDRQPYMISFKAKWIVGSPTLLTHGHNLASHAFDWPASHRLAIPEQLGTPGALNSVTKRQVDRHGDSNRGPLIDKVRQSVAVPLPEDPVEVVARVRDPDGVAAVSLVYRIEPGGQNVTLPMDGPDERNRYRATVPGQSLRRRVVYHIEARDTLERVGRFPVDKLTRTHPMVLDPATRIARDERSLVYRHDRPQSTRVQSYRVWMTTSNEEFLKRRKLLSNDMIDATYIFGEQDLYHGSRVRFSGSPWARGGTGGSYRVGMPKDKPLHGTIKKFNLEQHQGDGGLDARERISNYLIRHNQGTINVPYSYAWLAQYQLNDVVTGVREHVQTPNVEFIQRWYADDDRGAFFEMDDRFEFNDGGTRANSVDGTLQYPPYGPKTEQAGQSKENYRFAFSLRMDERLDDYSELINFARVLDPESTDDQTFDEIVFDVMDVEQFLRVWAIRMNTDDWDQWGTARGKNCYIYRPAIDGRWVMFAWDMELTYENVSSFLVPAINRTFAIDGKFPEVRRLINRPPIKRMYYAILQEMLDHQFNSQFLAPYVSGLRRNQMRRTEVGRTYIDRRAQLLLRSVASATAPRVLFVVRTNGGDSFVTHEPMVALDGIAPVQAWFVLWSVNGVDPEERAAFESVRNPLEWTVESVPLERGANTIEFFAFSNTGELLDTTSIDVTYTTTAPGIDRIDPPEARPGDPVQITGDELFPGAEVFFGDTVASEVASSSPPTVLTAVVPELPPGAVEVFVKSADLESNRLGFEVLPLPTVHFIRGDVDISGKLNIADAVALLRHLFRGAEIVCEDAADANDNGELELIDALRILEFLFRRGKPVADPFPEPGFDGVEEDGLGCEMGVELGPE